jgi:hypothetical protein
VDSFRIAESMSCFDSTILARSGRFAALKCRAWSPSRPKIIARIMVARFIRREEKLRRASFYSQLAHHFHWRHDGLCHGVASVKVAGRVTAKPKK